MARPTAIYYGEDAGDTYYFWQWIGDHLTPPQIHHRSSQQMTETLHMLDDALPGLGRDDTTSEEGIRRILTEGAFANVGSELALARRLSELLLPDAFAAEIVAHYHATGEPLLLRILPSPRSARVPWELLTLSDESREPAERRLIEYVDIVFDPPAGIYAGRSRSPAAWTKELASQPAVYLIDPALKIERCVLSDDQADRFARESTGPWAPKNPAPHGVFDRQHLSTLLRDEHNPPSRLLYVGHVASSDVQPGATSMLLSDGAEMYGITQVIGPNGKANRPFSAFDAVEGTIGSARRTGALKISHDEGARPVYPEEIVWPGGQHVELPGAELWPMPPRVALIACNSGHDVGHPEPFGLVIAFINSGAGIVTATRWTLPTDHAMTTLAGQDAAVQPLLEMSLAVDRSQLTAFPERELADWQRGELQKWTLQEPGELAYSPIIWASLSTYLAPHKEVRTLSEEELAELLSD